MFRLCTSWLLAFVHCDGWSTSTESNREIIGFNNKKYYNSKLQIQSKSRETYPLVYVDVKSNQPQIKNTSPAEVDEVVAYAQQNPDKSIAVITDYCDHHSYMNGDQALRAGGSLWMAGFIGGEMAFETGSNSYLQALRRAAKQTLYMYLHVRVTNRDYAESIGDTTAVRHAFTTSVLGWRHLVALIDLVAVALFALAIRGIVRDIKLYKAAKKETKNA